MSNIILFIFIINLISLTIFMFYTFCCLFILFSLLFTFICRIFVCRMSVFLWFSWLIMFVTVFEIHSSLISLYTFVNPNNCALCWLESRPSGDRLLHRCARSLSVALPDVWETDGAEWGNESDFFSGETSETSPKVSICSLFSLGEVVLLWHHCWNTLLEPLF